MTLRLNGDSSGFTEIKAPNAAGDNSITLPTSNGGANQLLQNGGTAGSLQYTSAGGGLHYDSAGRLLVGTSSYSQSTTAAFKGGYGNVGNPGRVALLRGYSVIQGNNVNAEVGRIIFADDNGDGDGAQIRANIDGTSWSTSSKPTRLEFYTTGSGGVSPTARLSIGSNGALKLLAGCPGIDFSGIQTNGANSDSETLDHYEEGTWTPTPTHGSSLATSTEGRYTRIGDMVWVNGLISNMDDLTTNSNILIGGLPFTSGATNYSAGAPLHRNVTVTAGGNLVLYIGPSATQIQIWESVNGANYNQKKHTHLLASNQLIFSLYYRITA